MDVIAQRSLDHANGSSGLTITPVEIPAPWDWVALDIETCNGRPEDAERWMRLHWSAPKNYKSPEAIGKHYLERLDEKKQKLALLDAAPIVIVSLKSATESRCLHCLREELEREAEGAIIEGFATAREMLIALRSGLDLRCDGNTLIVGHNVRDFDLLKLRWAYIRAGLRMPHALSDFDQPIYDTMRRYGSHFSVSGNQFVALADVLEEFGIPSHKGEIDGSMVPQLVAEGRFDELIQYALLDARTEAELFLRMTGQVEDSPCAA